MGLSTFLGVFLSGIAAGIAIGVGSFAPVLKKRIDRQTQCLQNAEETKQLFKLHLTCIHWAKMSKEKRDQIGVSDSDMKRCNIITKKMVEMVVKAAAYGDKSIDHNFQNDVEKTD